MTPNGARNIKSLPEGAVLVTTMTTPEVFQSIEKLVAIVTQVGGVTCHAAVVAREYGIPTVVACKEASYIQDGDLLTVDGQSGKVVVVRDFD